MNEREFQIDKTTQNRLTQGRIYLQNKETRKAQNLFTSLYKKYKNSALSATLLEEIANCEIMEENYEHAIDYLIKATNCSFVESEYRDKLKIKLAYCFAKIQKYKQVIYVINTINDNFIRKEYKMLHQKSILLLQPVMLKKFRISEIRKNGTVGMMHKNTALFAYKVHLDRYFTTSQLYDSMRILAEDYDVLTLHMCKKSLILYSKSKISSPTPVFQGISFQPIDMVYPIIPEITIKKISNSIQKQPPIVMRITELYENPMHDVDTVIQNKGTIVLSFTRKIHTTMIKNVRKNTLTIVEGLSYILTEKGYYELINSRNDRARGKHLLVNLKEKYLLRDLYMHTNHLTQNMELLYEKDILSKHYF